MSARNPDNVVIVGGGVAGWMAASYLKAAFGDRVSVTLLDPGAADAVEDDEASMGDLGRFFDVLGLVTGTKQEQHRVSPHLLALLGDYLNDLLTGIVAAFADEPVNATRRRGAPGVNLVQQHFVQRAKGRFVSSDALVTRLTHAPIVS